MNKRYVKKVYFLLQNIFCKKNYLKNIVDNRSLTILNLHKVAPETNPFYPSLSPALFEELLKFIVKEFNVITFRGIKDNIKSNKPNIILSFDDGFYDFLEYTMPILEKYNVRANLNVIPQCMESGRPVWDVMLGDFLNQTPIKLINEIELPNFQMKLNKSNKSQYGLALTRYLKQRTKEEREKLWINIDEAMKELDIKFTKMLSKDDVVEISKIHEIGVHSYSHESMALESKAFFENDFLKCKEYFKNKLDLPFDTYAFPSGSYEDYQLEFLKDNGIKYILLVNENYANYQSNVYDRFTFYGDSINEIKMRALGWHR